MTKPAPGSRPSGRRSTDTHPVSVATDRSPLRWSTLAVSVCATAASVLPGFLTGALGVQLRDELDFGATGLGLAVASFFLAGALASMVLGRVGEQLGARRALTIALGTTAATNLSVAVAVDRWDTLVLALAVAGAANALTQTAANLLLGQTAAPDRLVFSVSVKQSGMPTATLLGGLSVPLLAETVGWRWAYVAAAGAALGALAVVRHRAPAPVRRRAVRRPDLDTTTLALLAVAIAAGAYMAGTLASWMVSSAEAAGLTAGRAGLLLSLGSIVGIGSRLAVGEWTDRRGADPLPVVTRMLVVGVGGVAVLAVGSPSATVVGALIGFAFGWAWPGLFNAAVVRANPSAPGAATGITQTGTYLGVVLGPVVTGLLVDGPGYATAWVVAAATGLVGAGLMVAAQRRLHPRSSGIDR